MPKYLVTATAFKRAKGERQAYAPRAFTFEIALGKPWSAKSGMVLGDIAFHHCHQTFGFWPEQNPQIDSVVEVRRDEHTVALLRILDLIEGAEANDVWDRLDIGSFMALIPSELKESENTETVETASDDTDDLI